MKAVNYPTRARQNLAEIAIFDAQIDDLSTLLNGLKPGIEVFVLHPKEDGLAQISAILASRKDIHALHLISHGAPGQLLMGRSPMTAQDLTSETLKHWQQSLSSDAEILIYGCNVAAGAAGRAFISQLHMLTGAKVAASSTPTGNAALGGNWTFEITSSDFTPTMAFDAASIADYAGVLADLITGLGGSAGFGENTLSANDDGSTEINITSVFTNGLDFFGTTYNSVFLNNNGNITFASAQSAYTPTAITGNTGNPIIAPYFGDVDTRGTGATATPGGTSTGANRVHWDLDTVNGVVTFTWDDVGYFSSATNRLNAFQVRLIDQGSGDFGIEFRYEDINWTTGNASGGSGGLGGSVATAGWSSGNGSDFFQLSQSGNQNQMLDLENAVNTNGAGVNNTQAGIFSWGVADGGVVINPTLETIAVEATGTTIVLTLSEPLDEASVPDPADFTVDIDGVPVTPTSVDVTGDTVTLTLPTAVDPTDTVTVDYELGTNPLQDLDGNDATPFTDQAAENNSVGDTTPPAAPIIAEPTSDVSDLSPTISGTAEANATVELFIGGVSVGTTTADNNGDWSVEISDRPSDGDYTVTATATDAANNTSGSSAPFDFTIDTTAPGVPTLTGDSPTDDATPEVSGTAEPDATVEIFVDGVSVGTTTADNNGDWSFSPPSDLAEGDRVFTAQATDDVGNTSNASTPFTVTIDSTAPGVPTVTGDSPTDDATPEVSGTAEPGATVEIFVDGVSVGTTTADNNGDWSFSPPSDLAEGDRVFTAQATDDIGNTSNASAPFTVTIDTTAPGVPTVTGATPTNDVTPEVSGTAEAGATVEIFVDGVSVGTTTADNNGNWSFSPPSDLAEGDRVFTAQATDDAGNTSNASTPFTVAIDTTAPGVPTVTGDSPTDDFTPEVSGTAEPGATVEIFVDGVSVGTTNADNNGDWNFSPPSDLNEGDRVFTAQATDDAGNPSGTSDPFTVRVSSDIVPPAAPTLTADTPTNDRTPEFSGMAEPGATVEIFVDNVSVGTTTADNNGDWSFSPPSDLSEGDRSVSVTATDAAGNTSERSQPLSVRIDAQAPGAPTITGPSVTGDQTPTFSGTAEAGATVAVLVDGVEVGTTTASGTGEWTFELPTALADGDYDVTATAEDAAGNVSSPSNTVSTTIDTTLPIVPTIEGDALTNDATPTLSGEAEPGVTIEIFNGNTLVGTTTADGNGDWTFTFGDELPDGEYTFGVVARDGGGNESESVVPLAMVIDTTAPVAPTLTGETVTNDTTPTFSGTAEPGTTLEVFDGNTSLGTTTVDGQGNWEFTPTTPLAEGEYDISAQATDATGNTSPSSPVLDVLIDTTAPESPEFTGEVDASNNPPIFQGTAEPGTTIEVYDGDALVGRTTVDDSGEWSFTPEDPLEPGNREVTFRAIDPAGNESGLSDPISVFAEDVSGTLGVVLSATRLRLSEPTSIVEGDNLSTAPKVTTFTVALESQPSSDVVLNVSSSDVGEAALSTSTLTFTSANWDQPQTVTVRAIADEMYDVTQDVTVTVSVDSANSARGFANMVDQTIAVAVEHVGPTPGSDRLVYGPGRDRVFGMADDDRINGGAGNDRLNGEGGSDRLFGGTGNDRLLGMAGADNLIGGAGNDRMLGGVGNDRLTGNAGDERLAGAAGADVLIGGAGIDTMLGGAGNDRLIGGGGRDLMRGNVDNDVLNGGAGDDRMFGGLGNDRLNGQGGDDLLRGGEGRDILKGGSGNDRIAGEMGNDKIFSGAGRDRIVLRQGQGFDRIIDFEDGFDRMVLAGIRFNDLTFQQQREGVLITNGNENVALLRNMTVGQLSQADFV